MLRSLLSAAIPLAASMLLAAAPLPAHARPFQLEDLLNREALGAVVLTPDERWLVVERRAAYASGARFDFGLYNESFRTTLSVADLRAGGALKSLFPREPGFGYQAGPVSPDGRRLAVFRVSDQGFELGLTTIGSGQVRWLGVSVEPMTSGQTVLWLSPETLLAVALPRGRIPYELLARRPQAGVPPLWAATARGEPSVTALGSGAYQALRPTAAPKVLVRVSAETGAIAHLATGEWTDLEASPSGRWIAVLEAGPEIPLAAARPPQGDYGIAVRKMRLRLLDLASGRISTPCPDCDVLASLLSWSAADRLLVYVRGDDQPWTAGRLATVEPRTDQLSRLETEIRPATPGRPERVFAAWWDHEPLVYGRPAGGARDDWFRLTSAGPVKASGALRTVPRSDLTITPAGPLAAADGSVWRFERSGSARRISLLEFAPIRPRFEWLPTRASAAVGRASALTGRLGRGSGARAVRFSPSGPQGGAAAPEGTPLAIGRTGAALRLVDGGGRERLIWRRSDGRDQIVAELNPHLLDVEPPGAHPIHHPGPAGEPQTSWLFLPAVARTTPPGLVVIPYPGSVHRTAPDLWEGDPMFPAAILLGQGYAVLVPSLAARDGGGPADGLASRILAVVDAAARQQDLAGRFDPGRMVVWGHSFSGYAALTVVGQTDRFAAAVAVAARTNLTSAYGQFSPWRRVAPHEGLSTPWTAGWTESLQGDMRAPPWEDPDRYIRNSPLFQAGRIHTPVLIATGELDGSHLGQAEEMFSALYRQGKDAILLTYWGELHVFASPGNLRDFYQRALAFTAEHLDAPLIPRAAAPHPEAGSASSGPTTPLRTR